MLRYIIRRLIYVPMVLLLVSILTFLVIEAAPGDYVTGYAAALEVRGMHLDEAGEAALRQQFGLNLPPYLRYFKWASNLLRGRLGVSFGYMEPVTDLIAARLPYTVAISLATLSFVYIVAIGIGIYSATHQYSGGDYVFTVIGFVGLATPNFVLALILMYFFYNAFGVSIGGLFSLEFQQASWSVAKFVDLLKHLPIPIIVVGTAGTAGLIRVMRGILLDELSKQYVVTARVKGVGEKRLLFRYPVRMAVNPIISTVGWILPAIVSGETITAVVLGLPTIGPLLLNALITQDSYLAGSIVMILSALTVVGTLLSDILLVVVDPRIRMSE